MKFKTEIDRLRAALYFDKYGTEEQQKVAEKILKTVHTSIRNNRYSIYSINDTLRMFFIFGIRGLNSPLFFWYNYSYK